MKFKYRQPASWDIRVINPNTLSYEQAEFFYAKAIHEGAIVTNWPKGSMGRLTVASEYVRHVQRELRTYTRRQEPEC